MSLMQSVRAPLAAALLAIAAIATTALPETAQAQASAPAAEASAPVAAPEAAALPAATTTKEEVLNPYGLEAMWKHGDIVARSTLIIMIIMSISTWYVMFTKLWEQSKLLKAGRAVGESFWKSPSMKQAAHSLEERSAFRYIAESGVKADEHHEGTLVEQIDRHTWISMSIERAVGNIQSRLQDGLALLATVGSTAPFVGLFGTVWGIYHALTAIGISGQASIDKVAGPVGEALIMTAIGLAVAVPAVMGYNWLIRRNKSVMEQVRAFSGDVHNVLLAGKR
ncbi:MotA/TolQ/ExbB proton channel family protein [Aquabacterium sp. OR-4]|uniref:MotA/TolQ/ExbB proton channel family protein n=1 Tax=Aquabacterium sp. OR-4 TaxID=2978127 RepID=UPI0021B38121|nr:MotA/TolQ/ExbB proton channel family protein [Aquabacterium sp. OR-4]MDT7836303.1 MotA/TolQ/ExbB proton channel family protein [Aquabacterium sp. OR-4]